MKVFVHTQPCGSLCATVCLPSGRVYRVIGRVGDIDPLVEIEKVVHFLTAAEPAEGTG